MAGPKVFFVHLRRPNKSNPHEQRDDPFYEFGSFGCTKCHSHNLFNPRHSKELNGARLAFVQGGAEGSRLVFLTPPVKVKVWDDCCEARWTPKEMPFKYSEAPVLASNDDKSHFALIEKLAHDTTRQTPEGRLSSLFRSRTFPLPSSLAKHVIRIYERIRADAPRSAIASTYDEALPYPPPKIDRKRKATYDGRIRELTRDLASQKSDLESEVDPAIRPHRCGASRQRRAKQQRRRHCN